ncbi:P22 phage major capsid protein family protein [Bradyrhizobium lablabi]|uniref:P22 phage major capsid protein family protein n=1 Tax=Bradyrhizobium lablabi TaxID=722472 RepID=UPI001BA78F97|nr:P22 phage major capsid protein family protein [Bradyrhizobium lablabi]MBR0693663.1 hypothetical protein [Bradyrhizobium lablabi]
MPVINNTLTNLIPTLYESLDVVSRELVGFIGAVNRNSSATRAALNESILVPIVPTNTMGDNTPDITAPATGNQTIGNVPMTISKSKHVPIRWNGEEQRGMLNAGTYGATLRNQFTQAFRTICNAVETDLAVAAYQGASRAFGNAGTAPFGTAGDLSDIAGVLKIMDDNGAPPSDRHLVLGTAAMANIRGKQNVLFKVNEAGTDQLLRDGMIGRLEGAAIHNSGQTQTTVKGTGTAYTTTAAGFAAGTTVIPLITGSGTIVAGDVVTFANDPAAGKYVVAVGIAAPGSITINAPGLVAALPSGVNAVTVANNAAQNVMFDRNAIQLITRAPQMPLGPDGVPMDMADDVITLTDPISNISFDVAVYRQFMSLVYHVRLAWGVAAVKSAHIATLIG